MVPHAAAGGAAGGESPSPGPAQSQSPRRARARPGARHQQGGCGAAVPLKAVTPIQEVAGDAFCPGNHPLPLYLNEIVFNSFPTIFLGGLRLENILCLFQEHPGRDAVPASGRSLSQSHVFLQRLPNEIQGSNSLGTVTEQKSPSKGPAHSTPRACPRQMPCRSCLGLPCRPLQPGAEAHWAQLGGVLSPHHGLPQPLPASPGAEWQAWRVADASHQAGTKTRRSGLCREPCDREGQPNRKGPPAPSGPLISLHRGELQAGRGASC